MSSEQKVKVPIGTELPDSVCYAHSHKHLELGDEVALQVGWLRELQSRRWLKPPAGPRVAPSPP